MWGPLRTPGAGGAQVPTMGFGAALLAAERGENDLGRYMWAPRLREREGGAVVIHALLRSASMHGRIKLIQSQNACCSSKTSRSGIGCSCNILVEYTRTLFNTTHWTIYTKLITYSFRPPWES